MNKLPIAQRAQILAMLVEGASMRSVSRLADVSINTVSKLLEDAGRFCATHKTLGVTPAMAAGLCKTVMDWSEIVEAMDADAPVQKRGPNKKRG